MKRKRYKTVIGMVKSITKDKKFVEELKETIKAKTVYVYENSDDGDLEVFSTLKAAKKFAHSRVLDLDLKYYNGVWSDDCYAHIYKKKILD